MNTVLYIANNRYNHLVLKTIRSFAVKKPIIKTRAVGMTVIENLKIKYFERYFTLSPSQQSPR